MASCLMLATKRLALFILFASIAVCTSFAQEALQVEFVVNDALVKDQAVEGVEIAAQAAGADEVKVLGSTDGAGRLSASLPPATWLVSYRKDGYVGIFDSPTVVRGDGQVITTSLTPMLEAEGIDAEKIRVRIVLNWGSDSAQVRDADSHLVCSCRADTPHVYYASKEHQGAGHTVLLDVDDTDWGGPETITLVDPPAGRYPYWVHNYSGEDTFATSDLVVRVFFGDWMEAELRPEGDIVGRTWRPFKNLVIDDEGSPWLEPFTPEDLAAGAQFSDDPAYPSPEGQSAGPGCLPIGLGLAVVMIILGAFLVIVVKASR